MKEDTVDQNAGQINQRNKKEPASQELWGGEGKSKGGFEFSGGRYRKKKKKTLNAEQPALGSLGK